jgi:thermitase
MKKLIRYPRLSIIGLAICLALFLNGKIATSPAIQHLSFAPDHLSSGSGESRFAPDKILVKFKPTVKAMAKAATLAAMESRAISRLPQLDVYVVRIPDGADVETVVAAFSLNPDVEYAEPDFICKACATPNDTLFKYQYALSNTGQQIFSVPGSPIGKPSADIKATAAWEETEGSADVIIGLPDTGIDFTHPDLKNKYLNTGYDLINNDFDATDDFGHGTMVAGIIAAETNNNEGVAGVAWNCKILPVKVLDENGEGYMDTVADGIRWAVDNGAKVINLSLGGPDLSQTLRLAVQYAFNKDVLVVSAAGNDNDKVLYPAAFESYVLAAAGTDYNDERYSLSNFGAEIDVAAPCVDILAPYPIKLTPPGYLNYAYGTGTSFAAAHVSGLAALIVSIKPWLKAADLMNIIRYSADDVNSTLYRGKDEFLGYGRINMEKALVPIKIIK